MTHRKYPAIPSDAIKGRQSPDGRVVGYFKILPSGNCRAWIRYPKRQPTRLFRSRYGANHVSANLWIDAEIDGYIRADPARAVYVPHQPENVHTVAPLTVGSLRKMLADAQLADDALILPDWAGVPPSDDEPAVELASLSVKSHDGVEYLSVGVQLVALAAD